MDKLIIKKPRITEKAGIQAGAVNAYTFEVVASANKQSVIKLVKEIYKVNPVKVNIINLPDKKVFVRGKRGHRSGLKKALVFLKNGEKIEFV